MKLFALHGNENFADAIAKYLGIFISEHEEREFEDGEHKIRPLENVRNQDVFVVHSLYSDTGQTVNDKLCRLLFFISALKDASAKKVTAIIPYLCYSRKDRRTKSRDPVTTKYLARLIECSGASAMVTMDVHNLQAYQNAFSIPAENLEARKIFAAYLTDKFNSDDLVIMSPDFGGVKRAEQFLQTISKTLHKDFAFALMEKYRSAAKVWGEKVAGEVNGKTVIVIDDLISTGGTIGRTAEACKKLGAKKVIAMATHGLFTGQPNETLYEPLLEQIVVTNTVPPFRLENSVIKNKLVVLNVALLFADAIKRIYEGGSITELLENG